MAKISISCILLGLVGFLTSCGTTHQPEEMERPVANTYRGEEPVSKSTILSYAEFIPEGYSEVNVEPGDLNLDSLPDLILIVGKDGEDTLSDPEHPLKRKMMLLLRQADKAEYRLAAQNENAVYYYRYDANFQEPLVGTYIDKGTFRIDHYGGFATRWGRSTTFTYAPKAKNWFLTEDEFDTFDATNSNETLSEKVLTKKDFGRVSFEEFDIYKER